MKFEETLPDDIFSHHIESYWNVQSETGNKVNEVELLFPTCTFNIFFVEDECLVQSKRSADWVTLKPGAVFVGQRNNSLIVKSFRPINLFGVRFKPFAFARIIKSPIYILNDEIIDLALLFELRRSTSELIDDILSVAESDSKYGLINELMYVLFGDSLLVDDTLRAQLNFIMERRGNAKISELFTAFGVSKVTLRKHFINKVGLTPKKVSQIWRMNYLLKLKNDNPDENLTSLSLRAGFYDQAHFIKDFKLLLGSPPKSYFDLNHTSVKLAQFNINRRFSNQYDPR